MDCDGHTADPVGCPPIGAGVRGTGKHQAEYTAPLQSGLAVREVDPSSAHRLVLPRKIQSE